MFLKNGDYIYIDFCIISEKNSHFYWEKFLFFLWEFYIKMKHPLTSQFVEPCYKFYLALFLPKN
jgi:hypothetical protein